MLGLGGHRIVLMCIALAEILTCHGYTRANRSHDDAGYIPDIQEYGKTWVYMPDGEGVPQVALLVGDARSDRVRDVTKEDITFYLYTRDHLDKPVVLDPDEEVTVWKSGYDPTLPTRILSHGWRSSYQSPIEQSIKDAYLKKERCNIIAVDWSPLAESSYFPASRVYTDHVGQRIAKLIKVLVGPEKWTDTKRKQNRKKFSSQRGVQDIRANISDFHLVGHSLGAHIVGYAGRYVTPLTVSRITGLDPASPLFELTTGNENHLDPSDADFVDVIHTDGGILGFYHAIGHADFYPNGGIPLQPGCCCYKEISEVCSHGRAYEFFAESITSDTGFMSVQCDSWENFESGNCSGQSKGRRTLMGEPASLSARGVFYLSTNDQAPFAKGLKGI